MDSERRVAHYNLLESIGRGGLGEVFRARDTKVGRTVALKVLPATISRDMADLDLLLEDARRASALSHPSIATLFEVGTSGDAHYFACEFVAGAPLRNEIGGRPMNPRRALEVAIQIADGLSEAHAAAIVHGDVRPDTIAFTGKGGAKLLDTGLARGTRGGRLRRTITEAPEGLPAEAAAIVSYMSPEQTLGGQVDGRSDLFSLAIVLYEMLTGRNPFAAASVQDTLMNVISLQPPPPSSIKPDVTIELDRILARAFSKDILKRHESIAAFAAELRAIVSALDRRAGENATSYVMPVDDRADRTPAAVWLAGGAAVTVVAALVWWTLK
ncbi:MAG: serine/threonine-protein kinase [Vicinamibacterales bacterium]